MAALVRTGWGNRVQEEKRETEIAEESIAAERRREVDHQREKETITT